MPNLNTDSLKFYEINKKTDIIIFKYSCTAKDGYVGAY